MRVSIRRLLSYYRPHRALLAAILAAALLTSCLALAFPLLVRYVTTTVLASGGPAVLPTVYRVGGLMVGLLLLQNVGSFFVDYKGHELGARIENGLREELFTHVQRMSFGDFDRQRTGDLMSRITNDLMLLGEFYHHAPEDYLNYLLRFLGAFIILGTINLRLTVVIFAFLPLVALVVAVFNQRLGQTLAVNRQRVADINAQAEESLAGIRMVQAFANESLEIGKFTHANDRFLASRKHTYRAEAYLYNGVQAAVQLITVAVIVLGSAAMVHHQLNLADLITYLLYVAYVVEPIQRLAFMSNQLQEGLTGFRRFREIVDVVPAITSPARPRRPVSVRGRVEFRDVSFRYAPHLPPVLTRIALTIEPGEFVALVGPSGAGKTTLCSLLPRFYDVTAGQVCVDGVDVRAFDLPMLRRHIGLVQQDVHLFSGTVLDNIRYGRPGASDADVIRAAQRAHAHEFIARLPQGYASEVGQRGVMLSGGQKQRLSVARVFLKDPPILIFDEATSALDYESEAAVQHAWERMARERTTLVIAHRLSTVRHAERIIVLTSEGIVEEGTHHALLANGGAYARLYANQPVR